MEKKNSNEELQSRREFFKKAAKNVLPFVAAVALASNPVVAKAVEEAPMGCGKYTCSGGCKNGCTSCKYTCTGGCKNACMYTCKTSSSK